MSLARRNIPNMVAFALLMLYALASCYPFLWMVSAALKSNQEVLVSRSLIPQELRFDILAETWNKLEFWTYFVNSTVITLFSVVGIVLIYSLAGYGFAKTHFWGRDALFLGFVALLLIPGVTVLIPLVQLLRSLGLIGREATQFSTYSGVVLPIINGAGPLALFLFRNFFLEMPHDLHDAARVDGCSEAGIYARIYLPLAVPVIATVSILNIIGVWNTFIWPSIVINKDEWFTLPLKLKDLDLQLVTQWNVRMAGSLITLVPVIIVFLLLQRYYIRGLTAGSVKG